MNFRIVMILLGNTHPLAILAHLDSVGEFM